MTAGFGLEKLGLFSLRHPWVCLLIVAVITPVLAYGGSQLQYRSDVREIFKSDDPSYLQLDLLNQQFPDSQPDLQIIVESEAPFDNSDLSALRKLQERLEGIDGVTGVVSMFSAVSAPEGGAAPKPLFPEDLSAIENLPALLSEIAGHPLVAGKLLAEDWSLALFGLSLGTENQADQRLLVASVGATVGETLAETDLKAGLTGVAVIRDEIVSGLEQDQRTFRLVAIGLGLLLCWVFLRRLSLIVIAAIPAIVAVLWLRGGMWLFDQDINLLTGIAPTIILVIVLADSLHLLFAIRNGIHSGKSLEAAIEFAVMRVGPACVLTSLTTALAMASLIWMPHSFIASFGITTAAGALAALVVTLLLVPSLSAVLLRRFARGPRHG